MIGWDVMWEYINVINIYTYIYIIYTYINVILYNNISIRSIVLVNKFAKR